MACAELSTLAAFHTTRPKIGATNFQRFTMPTRKQLPLPAGMSAICPGRSPRTRRAPKAPILCSLRDVEYREDGPLEPVAPRFSRESFQSGGAVVVESPGEDEASRKRRRGRGRRLKPATPPEAMVGAMVSAACAVALGAGVRNAYAFLESNPPAHDVPMGLTNDVNDAILAAVAGLGGFAVSMFAVTSVGLLLLYRQLTTKEAMKDVPSKAPPQ